MDGQEGWERSVDGQGGVGEVSGQKEGGGGGQWRGNRAQCLQEHDKCCQAQVAVH